MSRVGQRCSRGASARPGRRGACRAARIAARQRNRDHRTGDGCQTARRTGNTARRQPGAARTGTRPVAAHLLRTRGPRLLSPRLRPNGGSLDRTFLFVEKSVLFRHIIPTCRRLRQPRTPPSHLTYHVLRNRLNGNDPLLPRPPDRGPVQRPGRATVPGH